MCSICKDLYEDFTSWLTYSIKYPYIHIIKGLSNYWKYRKIIWQDRWYDHDYLLYLIEFKLQDMEKHWGVDTHYEGDKFTKLRLQIVIRDLKRYQDMLNNTLELLEESNIAEVKKVKAKIASSFFKTIPRLWD